MEKWEIWWIRVWFIVGCVLFSALFIGSRLTPGKIKIKIVSFDMKEQCFSIRCKAFHGHLQNIKKI